MKGKREQSFSDGHSGFKGLEWSEGEMLFTIGGREAMNGAAPGIVVY